MAQMTDPVASLCRTTKFLIFSDTHGMRLSDKMPNQPFDVAIHCGDMTEESKLDEFRTTLDLLDSIEAPLKLIIAGNHDFTLDTPAFARKIEEARPKLEPALVVNFYGEYDDARRLISGAEGVHLLDEGTHRFTLQNGASLSVYASPYTPSLGDWGFQYRPNEGRKFSIQQGTNIVITHGPPRGILDRTNSRERAGCPDLFAAIAKCKPTLHCFGHIHEGWGAKKVAWRQTLVDEPSHLTDIDNDRSEVIEQLSTLRLGRYDSAEDGDRKEEKVAKYTAQRFCGTSLCRTSGKDETRSKALTETLFVNASIKGDGDMPTQFPWIVDIDLPLADDQEEELMTNSEGSGRDASKKRALDGGEDVVDDEDEEEESRSPKRRYRSVVLNKDEAPTSAADELVYAGKVDL